MAERFVLYSSSLDPFSNHQEETRTSIPMGAGWNLGPRSKNQACLSSGTSSWQSRQKIERLSYQDCL